MKHPILLGRTKVGAGSQAPLHLRWLSTPLRCHVFCGIVALGLIALSSSLWIYPEFLVTDRVHTPGEIEDAIELISSRNRLQNRFNQATERRRQTQTRIDQIAGWLPENRTWENVRSILQNTAFSCDVQLIAVDRDRVHDGQRVTVMDAQCELQGSYSNISKFLRQIVTADSPIWCDEIRIVRGEESDRSAKAMSGNHPPVHCLATISLRIPYAGKDTTAAKLLKRRSEHET